MKVFLVALLTFIQFQTSLGAEKFTFGLFENFVSNGKIFQAEVNIVNRLRQIQRLLHNAPRLKTHNREMTIKLLMAQRSMQFHNLDSIHQNLMVNSTTQDSSEIMEHAVSGIVQLKTTYNLDTELMSRGLFKSHNKDFKVSRVSMEGRVGLETTDLLAMAQLATEEKLYASAAEFIRLAEEKLWRLSIEARSLSEWKAVAMEIKRLKSIVVQLHNKYAPKRMSVVL